jgi:ABC-type multidrug transport system ATPase subunit
VFEMQIIETRDLTKKFNGRKAVDRLNLTIEEGELFGLLGPNGAGKSTTVAMLSTILEPTQGTAIVGGHDVREKPKEVRKIIGVMCPECSSNLPVKNVQIRPQKPPNLLGCSSLWI